MSDDEFYEDDEPIEDIIAAWNAGEKGYTCGPDDLSPRAKAIIHYAVLRIEGQADVPVEIVASGTNTSTFYGWASA